MRSRAWSRRTAAKLTRGADPIALMKAVKNAAEIAGARAAHHPRRRSGRRASSPGSIAKHRAASSPRSTPSRRSKAFAATPACSRIFPFRPSPAPAPTAPSCIIASPARPIARIAPGELFLINSGGQYEDGTTDITRTIAIGEPTAEMRDRFTRVLKGHIAIARAVFPDGTTGAQLEFLRTPIPVGGRARFRPWHRPWRRQLSFGARRPRTHFQARHRAARARHDPVERARLLQSRRLRHPHREPGAGDRRPAGCRRRKAAQCLRDADAGADRPQAGRGRRCSRPRKPPGSTAIMHGSHELWRRYLDDETRDWLAAATRPLGRD